MAKDSKRKRYVRRLKRENTLLWREAEKQQHQINVLAHMARKQHQEMVYRAELGASPEER